MKRWLAALLLFAAAPGLAADPPPAATAEPVDEREAMLRDLEFRTGKAQSGRQHLAQALSRMRADGMEERVFMAGCEVTNQTVKIPEFFQYARRQLKKLEQPANYQALTDDQRGRLVALKTALAALEAEPELNCVKVWEDSARPG